MKFEISNSVARELVKTQKPVFDKHKGLVNPLILNISDETINKLKKERSK